MKNTYKKTFCLIIGLMTTTPFLAFAGPFDWLITYRNDDDTDFTSTLAVERASTTYNVLGTRLNSDASPAWYSFSDDFTFANVVGYGSSYNYKISLGSFDWHKANGLSDILDGKVETTLFTNLASAVAVSTSTLGTSVSSLTGSVNSMLSTMSLINANLYGTSTVMTVSNASTTNGLMSKADKTKLDAISTSTIATDHTYLMSISTSTMAQVQSNYTQSSTTATDYIKNKPTLATIATTGSYNDLLDKPTRVFATSSRSLSTSTGATGFQPSSTKDVSATYPIKVVTTATIGSPSEGYVALEISPTNSASAGSWYQIAQCGNGQNVTLAALLSSAQTTYCNVNGIIPAGYYAKLRSVTVSDTPVFTLGVGQEVQLTN